MLHIPPTNLLLLAVNRSHGKKPISSQKVLKNFLQKVQENGLAGRKKDKTERVTGLGRRTRDELVKWNQMTALRSKRGETSDIPGLPLGGHDR